MVASAYLKTQSHVAAELPSWKQWKMHKFRMVPDGDHCEQCSTNEPCLIGLAILMTLEEELKERNACTQQAT